MHTILFMEDDLDLSLVLSNHLRFEGFNVVNAHDGAEGLRLARATRPDIILCDIGLPLINGYEVLRRLQLEAPTVDIPVIFLSGQNSPGQIRAGMAMGADDYLCKPVAPEDLLVALRARLEKRARLAAHQEAQLRERLAETPTSAEDPEFSPPLSETDHSCSTASAPNKFQCWNESAPPNQKKKSYRHVESMTAGKVNDSFFGVAKPHGTESGKDAPLASVWEHGSGRSRKGTSSFFESSTMKALMHVVHRTAPSSLPILISGENGTGKGVIAEQIHDLSKRSSYPLVVVECSTLTVDQIESDLFGMVRGGDAENTLAREGLLHRARGGTLVLRDLSRMPPEAQVRMLQIVRNEECKPLRGIAWCDTDVRVIATIEPEASLAIRQRRLREDLYYRVGVVRLHVPPLRERVEDILPLACSHLKTVTAKAGRRIDGFTQQAADWLRGYDWPGNITQLQSQIELAALVCRSDVIDQPDLLFHRPHTGQAKASQISILESLEQAAIKAVLRKTGGCKKQAAQALGIGRQTIYNKMRRYGIE